MCPQMLSIREFVLQIFFERPVRLGLNRFWGFFFPENKIEEKLKLLTEENGCLNFCATINCAIILKK